ncbi:hypothetical protein DEU56DRAFT_224899 [Suillus clintonianus]|uniref:uncharacterized protein n=1 Tax=Suillus clintonianus TaxID=1904413 RepID=UPI001B87745A|nr:uncharacterized protein DEU56DRAFT_224899 [Suillus clintonianus]KAG2156215.1 hypothetical protein DEU56DRAFT_224899 [Suillus clintonianus]
MGALDNTFGALLIGIVVSAMLYGGMLSCYVFPARSSQSQSHLYADLVLLYPIFLGFVAYQAFSWRCICVRFYTSSSDHARRSMLDTGHIYLGAEHQMTVYTYLVTNFGTAADIEQVVWSLIVEVLFNGFTALVVQSFLTMRIYRLSNKSMIATVSVLSVLSLVIGEFVLVVIYFAKAIKYTTFIELAELKSLSMSVNAVAAVGDILIAVYLCTLFQQFRIGFQRSDTVLNKLILFSISSGFLTSICAVMSFISITIWPDTFIYIAFYVCLGRLYCNSLLATLNARKGIRSLFDDDNMLLSLTGIIMPPPLFEGGCQTIF